MENRPIFRTFLGEPLENLMEYADGILNTDLYKSIIASIFATALCQKFNPAVIYSESILFAAVYFMKTYDLQKSFIILIIDIIAIVLTYNTGSFKCVYLLMYLSIIEFHFTTAVDFFLTKCVYFMVGLALGVTDDVAVAMNVLVTVWRYVMEYRRKKIDDIFFFMFLAGYLKLHYDYREHYEYTLLALYTGIVNWIINRNILFTMQS